MFNRMPKIVGSRDLGHAHFQGKLGIPDIKLHGTTNYRIDTEFDHIDTAKQGQGYESRPTVSQFEYWANCHW